MANIKDGAIGTILTVNSTTSVTLQSGEGALQPDPVFNALIFPAGVIPTKSSAERVQVTARPGTADTFTIVRAQGGYTQKSIQPGWLFVNAIFADDVFNASQVTNEIPAGTINGTDTVFTLASYPTTSTLRVYLNGLRQKLTDDFTLSGNVITFVTAPPTGSNLLTDYMVGNQVNSVGTNSYIAKEAVTGAVDGSNALFTTARAYIGGSLQVYVNGLMQAPTHVTETSPSAGTFTLDVAPATGDVLHVAYQYNLNPSSNADTVDGIHASVTPTPNALVPLNSNGVFNAAVLGGPGTVWTPTLTNITIGNGTVVGRVSKVGKRVTFRLMISFGSTTSMTAGYPTFTLPSTAATVSTGVALGNVQYQFLDSGTAWFYGHNIIGSAEAAAPITVFTASGAYVTESGVSPTIPFTWTTGDRIYAFGTYEEA